MENRLENRRQQQSKGGGGGDNAEAAEYVGELRSGTKREELNGIEGSYAGSGARSLAAHEIRQRL